MDKYDKMWTVTDGGYEGSPYGYEAPSLYCIDAATFKIEKQFKFKLGDWPSEVQLNGERDKLYWINNDIWSMDVTANRVPVRPFLEYRDTKYYGLTVNPVNGEVYVADAIDYQQRGMIYATRPKGVVVLCQRLSQRLLEIERQYGKDYICSSLWQHVSHDLFASGIFDHSGDIAFRSRA